MRSQHDHSIETDETADLDMVADELNNRPRKTLDYRTPAEVLNQLIVATTP